MHHDPKQSLQDAVNSLNLRVLVQDLVDKIVVELRPAIQKAVDEACQPTESTPGAPPFTYRDI